MQFGIFLNTQKSEITKFQSTFIFISHVKLQFNIFSILYTFLHVKMQFGIFFFVFF